LEDTPTTLSGLLEAQADALGDKPFLIMGDRTLGFAEFNRQVNRAAHGLAKLGVKRGVGVSIMMANSPEWLFVYFATQKLGAYAHRPLRLVGAGLPPRLRGRDRGDP
jgi:crotonobetaine/carnitine-CoA ligase